MPYTVRIANPLHESHVPFTRNHWYSVDWCFWATFRAIICAINLLAGWVRGEQGWRRPREKGFSSPSAIDPTMNRHLWVNGHVLSSLHFHISLDVYSERKFDTCQEINVEEKHFSKNPKHHILQKVSTVLRKYYLPFSVLACVHSS